MEGLCQQTMRTTMPDLWWPRQENTPHRNDAAAMNDWRRERWGNCRSFPPRRYSNRYICKRWYPWDVDRDRTTSSDRAKRCPNWNSVLTRMRMKTNSNGRSTDSREEERESCARRSSRRTSRDSISSSSNLNENEEHLCPEQHDTLKSTEKAKHARRRNWVLPVRKRQRIDRTDVDNVFSLFLRVISYARAKKQILACFFFFSSRRLTLLLLKIARVREFSSPSFTDCHRQRCWL